MGFDQRVSWLLGSWTLAAPGAQGLRWPWARGLWCYQGFFTNLWQLTFLCCLALQVLKGHPWLWSFYIPLCITQKATLSEVFLRWSDASAIMWGESAVRTPPRARDSAAFPCLCSCLAFLQVHPLLRSPPSQPHDKQQSSPWGRSPIRVLQLPATMHTKELAPLYGAQRAESWIVYVLLTLFRLSRINRFTLQ